MNLLGAIILVVVLFALFGGGYYGMGAGYYGGLGYGGISLVGLLLILLLFWALGGL